MVEDLPETIELLLLQPQRQSRRLGRIFFEGTMHALMPAILLRSAGLNAFVNDAQLGPGDRQLGQAEQSVAGERSAVVGPDPGVHAVLVHGGFADRDNLVQVHTQDGLTADEIAAVRIGNRERITSRAVVCAEVALEIHTPELVRCRHCRERF